MSKKHAVPTFVQLWFNPKIPAIKPPSKLKAWPVMHADSCERSHSASERWHRRR
ncbi:MAG TPA: hypothetical protein VFC92_14130 [Bacteroidales bacterium]|nr:hypothetical protein [Bacteroidales bacterium]